MSDEIVEIIRALQLTSSDDTEYLGEHNDLRLIDKNNKFAEEWLDNPAIDPSGEEAIRQILDAARQFESLCMSDAERNGLIGLIKSMDSRVNELIDAQRRGDAAAVRNIGSACRQDLSRLLELCRALFERTEHQNAIFRLARTLEGKVTQAQRWMLDARGPQRHVGYEACRAVIAQGNQLLQSESEEGLENDEFKESCDQLRAQTDQLYELTSQPLTSGNEARREHELASQALQTLITMWHGLQRGLVRQVADYFTDIVGPIKHLQEATTSDSPMDELAFQQAADSFLEHSRRVKRTANLAATNLVDPWRGDALQALASDLEGVSSQVSMAGRAVMSARQTGASAQLQNAASDHFDLVKKHWTDCAERTRNMVDEAIDARAFIQAQESGIAKDVDRIEDSVDQHCPASIVNATTSIALRANRVLQVAMRETENSEDPVYVDRVGEAVQRLRSTITPMVADAKSMVLAMDDPAIRDRWRASSRDLAEAVAEVGLAVAPNYLHPNQQQLTDAYGHAVPRQQPPPPPPPHMHQRGVNGVTGNCRGAVEIPVAEMRHLSLHQGPSFSDEASSRPLSPETDIEEEFNYPPPEENQPIMAAAHALHQEARLWSSRDNELISATKRIAALMAKLSQIVRGEYGNKKDLINVSMAIAEASIDVTRCAKALGKECTDRRMKSNLFQLSERIQMIGNQLKILSTVKATMLGDDGIAISPEFTDSDSPEDQENTEVLVGNAQNLMQAVIETVRVAEGASIKMRVDSGFRIRWMPRPIVNGFVAPYAS